ncbi:MAG: META domain-containing protein [Acidimicrobiales bacterium]
MSTRSIPIAVLVMVLLPTVACGDAASPSDTDADVGQDLVGRTFISRQITVDGEPHELIGDSSIRLTFEEGPPEEVRADAGCNTLHGRLDSTADQTLTVSSIASTEMGCPSQLHAQDEWVIDVLTSEPEWRLDGDTLVISTLTIEIELLDRRVADPDRPLEGTRWDLDSIVAGSGPDDAVTSFPSDEAHLRFEDGSVTGYTGCNEVSGRYELDGDAIVFDQLVQTDVACPGQLATGEEAIAALSGATADVSIEGRRLWLIGPDGGLGLQSAD